MKKLLLLLLPFVLNCGVNYKTEVRYTESQNKYLVCYYINEEPVEYWYARNDFMGKSKCPTIRRDR